MSETHDETGTSKETVLRIDANDKAMAVLTAMTELKARFEKQVRDLQEQATAEQINLWKQMGEAIGGAELHKKNCHCSIDEGYRESLGIVILRYHTHQPSLSDMFQAIVSGRPVDDDGSPTIN